MPERNWRGRSALRFWQQMTSTPAVARSAPITVRVDTDDPLTAVGITESLRPVGDVSVITAPENGRAADVAVVVAEAIDAQALASVRAAHARNARPVVVIATTLDETTVLQAAEAGARAILRRSEATPKRVAEAIRTAVRGEGDVPGDLLGGLLDHLGRLQSEVLTPRGLRFSGLTEREVLVLRLVSEGHETAEIAEELNYSQRTIKAILHDVSIRLNLRNRTHAVAYAIREGLI